MQPDVEVATFAEGHMWEVWRLWEAQYREEVAASGALPAAWSSRGDEVGAYLRGGTGSKYSAVATVCGRVAGYMLFSVFPFHGEPTAFYPVTCHAGQPGMRGEILEALYRHLSGRLVEGGVLSHCITYFAHESPRGGGLTPRLRDDSRRCVQGDRGRRELGGAS
jgi:hypothetical protein